MKLCKSVVASLVIIVTTVLTVGAQSTVYWDIDGANTGSAGGGGAPAGTWDGSNTFWNNDALDGAGAAVAAWVAGDNAVFSAASDATGTYDVTVSGTQSLNSLTVQEGTIRQLTGTLDFGTTNGVIDVASGATWNNSGTGTGTLAGTGGITKNGTGVLKLGGANTYTAASGAFITVNSGIADFTADLGMGAAPGAATAGAMTLNGGTMRFSGTGGMTFAVTRGLKIDTNGGTIEIPKSTTISGVSMPAAADSSKTFTGAGTLTKTGAGRFTFNTSTSASGFSGKYRILGGLINIQGDTRLGPVPATVVPDYLYMDGGGLRIGVTSAVTLSANRGITLGPGGGKLIQPGVATNNLTYGGIIAGTQGGSLTIDWQDAASTTSEGGSAGGIVSLTAVNTYDGATIINPGASLRIDADATAGNGAGAIQLKGGTLTATANRSVSTDPVSNPITLTANSAVTTTSTAATVNLNLSTSTFALTGGTTLTFRNDGADAATDLFDPRFSGSGFDFTSNINIDNGAVGKTRLTSSNQGALTSTQTFSGVISGGGSFRRLSGTAQAGGTTIFSGNNTFSGGVAINDGKVQASNSSGSATGTGLVTVGDGASGTFQRGYLTGTGTVGNASTGPVVAQEGGIIAPGVFGALNPIGTLTTLGDVTMNPLSTLSIELNGAATDLLAVGGALNLSGGSLEVLGSPGAGPWTIASYAGALSGTFASVTSGYSVDYGSLSNGVITLSAVGGCAPGDYNCDTHVDAGDYASIRKDFSDITTGAGLTAYNAWRSNFGVPAGAGSGGGLGNAPVPEPSAIVLLAIGLFAAAVRRRG